MAGRTVMVKDINSGGLSSTPTILGDSSIGNTLYFSATDGTDGRELWKTDGTSSGTVLVKDINSGAGSSLPSAFVVFNNTLFFRADDGINGFELWESDGN